jgi:hypothetical protein
MVAYATKNLQDGREEADMDHRLSQLQVAEVSRAVKHVTRASPAVEASLCGPHPQVKQTLLLGDAVLVSDGILHFTDGHRFHFVGAKDTELHGFDAPHLFEIVEEV